MFGEVEDQPKKTKKENISQSGLKIDSSAQSQVCLLDQHHWPGWCRSQSSGAEDLSVFRSRRPLRPKTSSEAEDFSIFGSRRLLNLQEPKTSQSSGAEDFLIFKA
ncbi:hypothetical protein L6452_40020 [Arctium lappa]|uniref:Uncharacterized protein n=1 Tax=Arctium lappa TaxID=4217 RepID=A0ACB8XTF0_ARCLA|nr:hypothetical protein L6452_40020 [Arctium lappa]